MPTDRPNPDHQPMDGSPEIDHLPAAGDAPTAAKGARALAFVVLAFGILLAGVGLTLPVLQLTQDEASVAITVSDEAAVLDVDPTALPAEATLRLSGADSVELVASDLPGWLRAATRLPQAVSGLLLLAGAWLVRRMLLDVAAGRPFDARMPGRLRGLTLVVLAGTILPPAFEGLASVLVTSHLGGLPDGSPFGVPLFTAVPLLPLLVALLLGIAAQVFESGRQLTDDLEGLV